MEYENVLGYESFASEAELGQMLLGQRHIIDLFRKSLQPFWRVKMASTSSFIPSKRPHEEIADSDVPMPSKGPTLPPATSQRFKNAVVLAPMVRSGTSK
jgi:hypothetical protein